VQKIIKSRWTKIKKKQIMSVFFFKFRQKNHPKKSPFENFDIFSFKILYLDTKLYFYTFQSLSFEREERKLHEN
jgi:hypothetical protein